MPGNFPDTPVIGDTYSYAARSWVWTGEGWRLQPRLGSLYSFIPGYTLTEHTESRPFDMDYA